MIAPMAAVMTVALVLGPSAVDAQEGCIFGDRGRNDVNTDVLPGLGRVTYVGDPHFVCEGGIQIFADSAVAYGDRGMSDFIGSVRFLDQGRELLADEARYFSNEGRLQAEGHVLVVDEEQGSSIQNGDLVYLLETEFRDASEMTVTVAADGIRPRAMLTPRPDTSRTDSATVSDTTSVAPPPDTVDAPPAPASDSAEAAPPEPYNVVADRIFIRGSGYFAASNDVVIDRDSLFAYADSAEYDESGGGLDLVGNARVVGESYELTGRTITMTDPGGDDSEIRALREARLTGEDLLLTSARIVVSLRDGSLHRLVATPIAAPGTLDADSVDLELPEADVEEFILTADSLDVFAPGERLQRVFAAGGARSVSTARDSLNAEVLPEIARNDWLEGDTVIIRFVGAEPVPPMRTASPVDSAAVNEALQAMDSAAAARMDSLAAADTSAVARGVADADSTAAVDSLAAPAAPDSVAVPEMPPTPDSAVIPDSLVTPDSLRSAVAAADPEPADETSEDLLAAPTPSDEAEVEEIIARIDARSLYRLPPDDSTFRAGADAPAVHYVVGEEIRIHLESGEVRGMSVTGQTRGVHLEPLRRTAPDSAAAADTAAVPDTAVVPDSGVVTDSATAPEGSGTKIAGTDARTEPTSQDGPSGPPKEHPWIRR